MTSERAYVDLTLCRGTQYRVVRFYAPSAIPLDLFESERLVEAVCGPSAAVNLFDADGMPVASNLSNRELQELSLRRGLITDIVVRRLANPQPSRLVA